MNKRKLRSDTARKYRALGLAGERRSIGRGRASEGAYAVSSLGMACVNRGRSHAQHAKLFTSLEAHMGIPLGIHGGFLKPRVKFEDSRFR